MQYESAPHAQSSNQVDSLVHKERAVRSSIKIHASLWTTDHKMAEKKEKKTKWSQKFKTEYSAMWPCVKESEKGIYHAFCTLCSANISVEHGGRDCIRRHVNSKRHTEIAKSRSTSSSTWMKHFTKPGQ